MKNLILVGVAFLIIGYIIGDYVAYHYAKQHGTQKFGGLFSIQPKAGLQADQAKV